MRKQILTGAAITAISVGSMFLSAAAFAQGVGEAPPLENVQPGTTPITDTNYESGFNPMWLLLLILIPIAFMFWPRGRDETLESRTTEYSGAKGGETSDMDEDEDYKDEGKGWHDESERHSDASRGR